MIRPKLTWPEILAKLSTRHGVIERLSVSDGGSAPTPTLRVWVRYVEGRPPFFYALPTDYDPEELQRPEVIADVFAQLGLPINI